MFWSGGKDSALALNRIFLEAKYDIISLVTTVGKETDRVSMHGIRRELLIKQVECIRKPDGSNMPVAFMTIPSSADNSSYEQEWERILMQFGPSVNTVIFGDIFLEDLRVYRESYLKKFGWGSYFPLWKNNTTELIDEVENVGIKSLLCAIDPGKINRSSLGRLLNTEIVRSWDDQIDPCGENGEYHTLTIDAPYFEIPLAYNPGEIVEKKYEVGGKVTTFLFQDFKTCV